MTRKLVIDLDDSRTVEMLLRMFASLEHEQWSHWIKYQLEQLEKNEEGTWRRWIEISQKPYYSLTEEETKSDEAWARKAIQVLERFYDHRPKCGLCGSIDNLVGPYAGGPFGYYCERCKQIIDRYLKGRKVHEE